MDRRKRSTHRRSKEHRLLYPSSNSQLLLQPNLKSNAPCYFFFQKWVQQWWRAYRLEKKKQRHVEEVDEQVVDTLLTTVGEENVTEK